MKPITTPNYTVFFAENAYTQLQDFIKNEVPSKIFILTDSNTQELCLPLFLQGLETDIAIEILEIEPGENNKTIKTCTGIWQTLAELGADRKSLLINLGGGVITDLGGFVASTFMRGIAFINIPTSLLAMVDASIGGKTGVNFENLKNQIGLFSDPKMVGVDIRFLSSLPQNQLRSGLAEMLKHGLIHDKNYWKKLSDLSQLSLADLETLIYESISIKNEIVAKDQRESGLRKILNFGHTLGHAIESHFLNASAEKQLLHGEAIAVGMILATFISSEKTDFPKTTTTQIKKVILNIFSKIEFSENDKQTILKLLKFDKKNTRGKLNFVLLKNIGNPVIDCPVSEITIRKAFEFYASKKDL